MTMSDRPKAIEEALKDWQPDIRSDIHLTPLENLQTALQEIFRLQARVAELRMALWAIRDAADWDEIYKIAADALGEGE